MFSLIDFTKLYGWEKIKTIRHLISVYSLYECVYMCVCVCVCRAGPVCVKWNGGGCLFSVTVRRVEGGRGRERGQTTWLAEIVFTLWPESDGNRTALPNRVLQIHRYTESVLRQNTADPSTFTTLPDQEKLAYLLGEHKTCCVFAAQYVSLCHHRREDTRLPWADVSSTCRLYYDILPFILLKCIFCLYKSYTVPYLILFLSHTYNSHSFCTTYLIRFKYLFYYYYFFIFISVNSNVHYLWAAQLQLLWQYKCIVFVMPIKHT